MIGKLLLHIENNLSEWSELLANKCDLFQKTAGGFGVVAVVQTQKNIAFFTLI